MKNMKQDKEGKKVDVNKAKQDSLENITEKEEKTEVEILKEEVELLNDKHLRLFAEFENYKKRSLKERLDLYATASEDIILTLLPIIDDFERAIPNVNDENDRKGFELIYNKLISELKNKGLEEIEVKAKTFDPEIAAAVAQIPAENDADKGIVIDEIEKGYSLKGKVIRHAKVVVGM
jgi:molecular chaperone GrpE